jgi:hypothetical protein
LTWINAGRFPALLTGPLIPTMKSNAMESRMTRILVFAVAVVMATTVLSDGANAHRDVREIGVLPAVSLDSSPFADAAGVSESSPSPMVVAQAPQTKKWKTREGREACSVQCKDGSTASQTCDKPTQKTCSCNCTNNSAGAAYCWCH